MKNNEFNADNASLSVDLSEARQAVKENRFQDALDLFSLTACLASLRSTERDALSALNSLFFIRLSS